MNTENIDCRKRYEGKIKKIMKDYSFIYSEELKSEDIFAPRKEIISLYLKGYNINDRVSFDIVTSKVKPGSLVAINVVIIERENQE